MTENEPRERDNAIGNALGIYARLFRNPAALVFMLFFVVVYSLVVLAITSKEQISFLEILKAAPFAFSALILGIFSVLFWALNYVGRNQKSDLKCKEVKELFDIRRNVIEEIFKDIPSDKPMEIAVLKAHILLSGDEINWEPESPPTSMAFDYGEAVKAILRRS